MGREQLVEAVLGRAGAGVAFEGADAAGPVQVVGVREVGAGRGARGAAAAAAVVAGWGCEGWVWGRAREVEGGRGCAVEVGDGVRVRFSSARGEEAEGAAGEAADFDGGGVGVDEDPGVVSPGWVVVVGGGEGGRGGETGGGGWFRNG